MRENKKSRKAIDKMAVQLYNTKNVCDTDSATKDLKYEKQGLTNPKSVV